MKNQIRSLGVENMRGLAAFFVAFGHLYYAFLDYDYMKIAVGPVANLVFGKGDELPHFYNYIPRAAIWVDIFFLISGFVIQNSLDKIGSISFFIQRFFRILPVFWIALIAQLLVNKYFFMKQHAEILSSFLVQSDKILVVAWTLTIELRFYLLVGILAALITSTLYRVVCIHTIFFVLFLVWKHFGTKVIQLEHLYYFCYMSIGMVLYRISNVSSCNDKHARGILALVGLANLIEFSILRQNGYFSENDVVAFPCAALIFFVVILLFDKVHCRVLSWLGLISYPLYCLHFPIGWATTYVLRVKIGLPVSVSVALSFSVVILFSYLVHLIVEMPTNSIGKKVSMIAKRD